MQGLVDEAALKILENGCEKALESVKNQFLPTPISSLTAIGDETTIEDVAFAASAPELDAATAPEMLEAWTLLKSGLDKLYRVSNGGKELKEQVGAAGSVRCFFEGAGKKKDLIVRNGTMLSQIRPALGWLFDAGHGEHIDFDPVPDSKVVAEGETVQFKINPSKLFQVSDPTKMNVKQPKVTVPISEDTSGPRDDRPTHVVCILLVQKVFAV